MVMPSMFAAIRSPTSAPRGQSPICQVDPDVVGLCSSIWTTGTKANRRGSVPIYRQTAGP